MVLHADGSLVSRAPHLSVSARTVAKLVAACLLCVAVFTGLTLLVLHFRRS
jgi:hypothetical protein